eukprot:EG_transcript_1694
MARGKGSSAAARAKEAPPAKRPKTEPPQGERQPNTEPKVEPSDETIQSVPAAKPKPVAAVFQPKTPVKQEVKAARSTVPPVVVPPRPAAAASAFVPVKERPAPAGSGGNGCARQWTTEEAVAAHPFIDKAHYRAIVTTDFLFSDDDGRVVCVVLKGAYPDWVRECAADVLRGAARPTSLRAGIFGGVAPMSGIAGYYDYMGAPVELKGRKTSFTHDHLEEWPGVFPVVDFVNEAYRQVAPDYWRAQDRGIPDHVRLHGSAFSTLTINQRFRTATHTDRGDYDHGLSVLTVLEGQYEGLFIGFPDFRVCVDLRPGDLMVFDSHYFHCNTEVESSASDWSRLSCVFYYRFKLGETLCLSECQRRKAENDHNPAQPFAPPADFQPSTNEPRVPRPPRLSVTSLLVGSAWLLHPVALVKAQLLHNAVLDDPAVRAALLADPWRARSAPLAARPADHFAPLELGDLPGHREYIGGFHYSHFGTKKDLEEIVADPRKPDPLMETFRSFPDLYPAVWETFVKQRDHWLELVDRDWKGTVKRNAERDVRELKFTWNNKGDMNGAFFELCETVRSEMVPLALAEEQVTSGDLVEQQWQLALALHLARLCVVKLGMPKGAMHVEKLNVKMKDFVFGGTRYFKDMPAEEQARRQKRKERIEALRSLGAAVRSGHASADTSTSWLTNDAFDYQTENRLPLPPNAPKYSAPRWLRDNTALRRLFHGFEGERGKVVIGKVAPEMRDLALKVHVAVVGDDFNRNPGPPSAALLDALAGVDSIPGALEEVCRILQAALSPCAKLEEVKDAAQLCRVMEQLHPFPIEHLPDVTSNDHVVLKSLKSAAVLRQPKALVSALPAAPDVVALQLVLHAVGEDAAAKLLRAAEQALAPHGALIVQEWALDCPEFHRLTPERQAAARRGTPPALDAARWLQGRLGRDGEYRDYRAWRLFVEERSSFRLCGYYYPEEDSLNTVYLVFRPS